MKKSIIIGVVCFTIFSCKGKTVEEVKNEAQNPEIVNIKHNPDLNKTSFKQPDWVKNAVIYEVNIRQYSLEGTFNKVTEDLQRIKDLGVDVIWLMPIHPIGEKKRKGSMGSYYSVKDYKAVNPEFGTLDDFKSLVKKAHSMNMKVIIDWVANHTAWDNAWVEEDINRYTADSLGNRPIVPADTDWEDTADLDYANPSTRKSMEDAMLYWVKETNIDGYRCDVAGMVPLDFWKELRPKLDEIKPVFMLAEWGDPQIHEAFDMSYAWDFLHLMNDVAGKKKQIAEVKDYIAKRDSLYQEEDILMYFTTNHDENSWNKTVFQRYGENHKNFATLAFTLDGMPLIYSGQEVGNKKELKFFEKDVINWDADTDNLATFYKSLIQIYKKNPVFWTGKEKGAIEFIDSKNKNVLIYRRMISQGNPVAVIINFGTKKYEMPKEVADQIIPKDAGVEVLFGGNFLAENGRFYVPKHESRIVTF
ncbi:MAG: alpha-amylase family glycosyl hydrolase [Flavobacteriales bacterium]